jgi:hypothetical protein
MDFMNNIKSITYDRRIFMKKFLRTVAMTLSMVTIITSSVFAASAVMYADGTPVNCSLYFDNNLTDVIATMDCDYESEMRISGTARSIVCDHTLERSSDDTYGISVSAHCEYGFDSAYVTFSAWPYDGGYASIVLSI